MRRLARGSTVILVHGGCADGYTSAGLLLRRHPDARVLYTHPSDLARRLRRLARRRTVGRVILADLSPQAADLDDILESTRSLAAHASLVWIDHHAPQWPVPFEATLRELGVDVVLDRHEKESGASLSARWTQEEDPGLQRVADLIRRRDAWTDPHDPEARAWTLLAEDLAEAYVRRLATADLDGLDAQGTLLLRREEERLAAAFQRVKRASPGVAWLWGHDDISDVADRLFKADSNVVFLLKFEPSGRVSIRSRRERPQAARLAQKFGGGGHANASGFSLGLAWWERVPYRILKDRHRLARRALRDADKIAAEPS